MLIQVMVKKINENTKNNQDSITGVIPTLNTATVTVNYLKQDGSQARNPYSTTVTGLAGKAIQMDAPAVVPGYVLVGENSDGTISEYTPDKVGQTWTRHFSEDDFGNNIYATYTLKNTQGDFEVKVYENDKLVGTYNLGASKSASYTDPSTGYVYSFPNPYDPDTANVHLTYQEVGNIVPVDKDGKQIGDKLPYLNNFYDPSKVESNVMISSVVKDYRLAPAEDQTSKDVTIKKVNNYNTGTVTPSDPTKDTEVVYIKDDTATIKVIYADISSITKESLNDAGGDLKGWLESDQSGVEILKTDSVTGKRGSVSDYTTASEIAALAKQGYKVVQVNTDGKLVDFDQYTPANNGTIFGIDYSDETNLITSFVTPPNSSGMIDGRRTSFYVLLYKASMPATQKITYHYADGAKPDSTAVSTVDNALTRTLVLNETSTDGPNPTYEPESSWTTYSFKDVLTPTVENYTPDKTSAGAGTATYENPVVEDLVIYTRKDGALTVKYVDQDNDNAVLESKDLSGKYGDKITYTTADTIKSLEAKGYELVSDGYTGKAGSEISDSNNGKTYLVVLKHGTTTITPDNPKDPNTPINPNDPDSPKYTEDQTKVKVPSTQTITYTGAGDKTPAKDVQTGEFDRTVTVDNVTGKTISSTPWTYTINGKTETGEELTYSTTDTPVVDGYHADKKVAGGLTATVDNPNVEDTVTYAANGKIVPVDPDGNKIPDAPTPTYPTDPNDPTKVTPDEPVPDIPGYTPEVPTVTPENPGKDTQVVYNKKDGSLAVKYVDQDSNNAVLETKDLSGKYGDKITYTTADTIKSLEDKGYELVSDGYTGKAGSEIGDSNNGKTYLVLFKHGTTTVTPDNPKDPNTPINPNDPNGPKYTDDQTDVTRDASQTVHYTGAGEKNPSDNVQTQKNAFTRTVTVDKVTGETISSTPWTGTKTFGSVDTPVVEDYHADKKVAGGLTATPDNPNVEDTVTYAANGKIVPVDPDGNKIPDVPTPTYPTDPTDPTKVTPDEPVPDIPGHTPEVPTVTPSDPGKDTPVVYYASPAAIVNFIDEDYTNAQGEKVPTQIGTSGGLTGKIGDIITYDGYNAKLQSYLDNGYVLDKSEYPTKDVYDNDDKTLQTFNVYLKHGTTTVTPDNPKDPNTPINPNDPNGPKYTEDQTDVTMDAKQTIHYTGAGEKNPSDNVQTEKNAFTRTVTVDKVTGKTISTTPWTGTKTFGSVDTPVVDEYHADKKVAGGLTATPENPNVEDTVTYAANGKIVPVDPNGNKIPNVPNPTYPTDPNDPTKVTPDEPVPDIPGYTPETPTVTPSDPGKDTNVPYTKNPTTPTEEKSSFKVVYLDQDNSNAVLDTKDLSGKYGDKITYTTADTIKSLEAKGYELVSDGYTGKAGSEFAESNNGKTYEVVLKHGTTTVTPDNPKNPGESINPNDPNGPKYTEDQTDVTRDASQTIHYTGAGDKNPSDNVQTQKNAFTRTVTIDKVTGKTISTTSWTGSKTFGNVSVPVVNGYHADKKVAGGLTATPENPNVTDTVTYKTNGKIVPVDPNGNKIPNVPTPTYPTDPNDPTKVTPNEPVPAIPGYKPETPTVTPENPGEDTLVVYNKKTKPAKPETPKKHGKGEDSGNTNPEGNKNKRRGGSNVNVGPEKNASAQKNTSAEKTDNSKVLPQTGEEHKSTPSLAGLLLAGAAFVLGLADTRKRRRH
ncbi:mucin-binding protein [Lactobacillus corticis]|uniref:Gram-positive cocci surface proteins LPxTG domain-containing protein n=1 Tax=Lactobacillus corticis TaxID=2201249 RepID=A0A916QJA7_9LACO|nr:LPXTG cell wall anchor domain-containing protein [Lactobacillus corticis]GFZ26290.1 hypothetical protein LCB40_01700 [Lactobacillus corticis]